MKLFSPAKINLFFRILKKRDDGFHEVATLLQAVSLFDTLYIEESSADSFTSSDPKIPTDSRNFICQARTLFRQKTGYSAPVAIHIEKKIPIEGGLGGGSGNIATTLWGLNQLSGDLVDEQTLSLWAGELSSDAPFFFSSGTAYATGRGENILSLSPLAEETIYLAKPRGGLSTPLIYRYCAPNVSDCPPETLLAEALGGNIRGINDLEYPAFALRSDLWGLKEGLMNLGFHTVAMTGSGSGFYCLGSAPRPYLPTIQFWKVSYQARGKGEWYSPRK